MDRIKKIKNSTTEYTLNNLFDPETYFNNLIGVSLPLGGKIQEIEIKCNALQTPYIKTKPIHHTQEIIKEFKNGDVIIRLWLINNYELQSVLLSYGSDLEIIKPLRLREDIKIRLQRATENYK